MCALLIQTNGLTERFNQTISRCLAKLINESQTDWDEKIDTVLEQCFEKEELTPFPRAYKPVPRCREKHLFIKVYCICGLPESYDSHMIECEECQKWFHFKCMKLTSEPGTWVCPECE